MSDVTNDAYAKVHTPWKSVSARDIHVHSPVLPVCTDTAHETHSTPFKCISVLPEFHKWLNMSITVPIVL
jgi:hypothetical protein